MAYTASCMVTRVFFVLYSASIVSYICNEVRELTECLPIELQVDYELWVHHLNRSCYLFTFVNGICATGVFLWHLGGFSLGSSP